MAVTSDPPTQDELQIELRWVDGGYEATTRWPGGETSRTQHRLPAELSAIDELFTRLGKGKGTWVSRNVNEGLSDPVRDLGERLFLSLTEGGLGARYHQLIARGQLRLCLATSDPRLADLPWELLYDVKNQDFVALSVRTPIVRRWLAGDDAISAGEPLPPIEGPLRVIVIDASRGSRSASLEVEALQKVAGDALQVSSVIEASDEARLLEALAQRTEPCLHFIGPTSEGSRRDGDLLRCGGTSVATATQVVDALRSRREAGRAPLRFAFWGRRDTDAFAARVAPSLAASIGVRDQLSGDGAGAFVTGLYRALAEGRSLPTAFTAARQRVDRELPGNREWSLPVMYLQRPEGLGARTHPPARIITPGLDAENRRVRLAQMRLEMHRRNAEALRLALASAEGDDGPEHLVKQRQEADRLVAEAERKLTEVQS